MAVKVNFLLGLHNHDKVISGHTDDCSICREPFSGTHWPVRAHNDNRPHGEKCVFGHSCLSTWAAEHQSCPLCRGQLYNDDLSVSPDILLSQMEIDGDSDSSLSSDENREPVFRLNFRPATTVNDNEQFLPALGSAICSARSTLGSIWTVDDEGQPTSVHVAVALALEHRMAAYKAGRLACVSTDYTRYQRREPGLWRGVPCGEYPLDFDKLLRRLSARFLDDLTGYQYVPLSHILDNDEKRPYNGWTCRDGTGDGLRRAPVAAHPLAFVVVKTIVKMVKDYPRFCERSHDDVQDQVTMMSAKELDEDIWDYLASQKDDNGKPLFSNFTKRQQFGGDLPWGFGAWVYDLVDMLLAAHVGPHAAQGVPYKKGVARVTVEGVKSYGWYESRGLCALR